MEERIENFTESIKKSIIFILNFPKWIKKQWNDILFPELKHMLKSPFLTAAKTAKSGNYLFKLGMFDIYYFLIVITLVAFGLIMHYSASYQNTNQAKYALFGIILMIFISQMRLSTIEDNSPAAMALVGITLILVFFAPEVNGTHRWFFGELFQPSEIAKITYIMFLGYLMDKYKKLSGTTASFRVYLCIVLFFGVLILLESHLSGCILFLLIGYAMMYFADLPKRCFIRFTIFALIVVALIVWKPDTFGFFMRDYQALRIDMWKKVLLNQDLTYDERINKARQVLQSLYGIGSGGIFGVGFGNSGQKVSNLQEQANDFIFAVVGEELGFVGGILMLFVYGMLVVRGIVIALKSKSYYGTLVGLGISVQMALQVLINVSVATSLLPNTGISLPFFSEGGSSMVFTLMSMGIMLSISKDGKERKKQNVKAEQ